MLPSVLSELELKFSGNGQEILCALGNICNSRPDKESVSHIAKFQRRDSGSRAENVREFSSRGRIKLHDCFRNGRDNVRE